MADNGGGDAEAEAEVAQVVDLLNAAQLATGAEERKTALATLMEAMTIPSPHIEAILEACLPTALEMHIQPAQATRVWVVKLSSKLADTYPPSVAHSLPVVASLVRDSVAAVAKASMGALAALSRVALAVLATGRHSSDRSLALWAGFEEARAVAVATLGHANAGVVVQAVKFVESFVVSFGGGELFDVDAKGVVLTSGKSVGGRGVAKLKPSKLDSIFNQDGLGDSPPCDEVPAMTRAAFASEAENMYGALVAMFDNSTMAVTVVSVVVKAVASIGRSRLAFLASAANVLVDLTTRDTIGAATERQMKSVRHGLKSALVAMMRLPAAEDHHEDLFKAMEAIGAQGDAENELKKVRRAMGKKRSADEDGQPPAKRAKGDDDEGGAVTTAAEAAAAAAEAAAKASTTRPLRLDAATMAAVSVAMQASQGDPVVLAQSLAAQGVDVNALVEVLQATIAESGGSSAVANAVSSGNLEALIAAASNKESGETAATVDLSRDPRRRRQNDPRREEKRWPEAMIVRPLSDKQSSVLFFDSFTRILRQGQAAEAGGAGMVRLRTLARLDVLRHAGMGAEESWTPQRQALVAYVVETLAAGTHLAVFWLYAEYRTALAEDDDTVGIARYTHLVERLLEATLGAGNGAAFGRLCAALPFFPDSALAAVKRVCEDPATITVGLGTLRDLILARPLQRDAFLGAVLSYTVSPVESIRLAAMRLVANKLVSIEAVAGQIEDFATAQLARLTTDFPEDEPTEAQVAAGTDGPDAIKRCMLLYFALTTKKHELLGRIMDVYVACHVRVRNVVLRQIGGLVRTIGAGASAVLDLVANPAEGGDNLVGHVLNILTAKNRPTRRLVETVLAVHSDRPNAQLLVYVTPGMTRDELSAHLPALVSLSKASLADAFDRMLRASKPRPMEASEVLVAIHMLDPRRDGVRLKAIADAIKVCFEAKAHFDADALATALHQMVDKNPIPPLFMRTMMLTWKAFSKLRSFLMRIMGDLVTAQVWKDDVLWKGYVMLAGKASPHSFAPVLQLPPRELRRLVDQLPADKFRLPLLAWVKKQRNHSRAIVELLEAD